MANNAKQYMRSVVAFSGGMSLPTNAPPQYGDRHRQYLRERTAIFARERAYLASDFTEASCQGLSEDFFAYRALGVRLADIASETAGAIRRSDDYKQVLFADPSVGYFPIGAKMIAMGSVWLCINPTNLSSASPTAVVARCNASYNAYDAYGNIVTEPLIVERCTMSGNSHRTSDNIVMMDGSFNVICQRNENTLRLGENKRIILGNRPYHITGFADFAQEFTGDRDSVRLLTFTVRVEEPTESDDMEAFIADGKSLCFSAFIEGESRLSVGQVTDFSAYFAVNGRAVGRNDIGIGAVDLDVNANRGVLSAEYPEDYRGAVFSLENDTLRAVTPDGSVAPALGLDDGKVTVCAGDETLPITFLWSSDDSEVAVVDADGRVTAVGEGKTVIRAVLAQNNDVCASVALSVEKAASEACVEFIGGIVPSIRQFSSATLTATLYEGGFGSDAPLTWTFSGANCRSYSVRVAEDGRSCVISCLSPDAIPLTVSVRHGDVCAQTDIALEGY